MNMTVYEWQHGIAGVVSHVCTVNYDVIHTSITYTDDVITEIIVMSIYELIVSGWSALHRLLSRSQRSSTL